MVIEPEYDDLLAKVDTKYTLCIVSARRARQINDMINGVRDRAILSMSPTQIAALTSTKPLSSAMSEIASGDISYERVAESYK
ncbi:MAG: DNA-directed RNA polymerase subunit omega [Actinobacteria bacterium]|nr:DNA-directed RNA polymerase subunit omega [Actinomycetota bacterium]MCL5887263.1 DNA-directed RNA polymerase subunit omega [Actinomycetota bacterium]